MCSSWLVQETVAWPSVCSHCFPPTLVTLLLLLAAWIYRWNYILCPTGRKTLLTHTLLLEYLYRIIIVMHNQDTVKLLCSMRTQSCSSRPDAFHLSVKWIMSLRSGIEQWMWLHKCTDIALCIYFCARQLLTLLINYCFFGMQNGR